MDIRTSPTGKVIKALKGYQYFVPNPLPPKIEWNTMLVNSLSRADHILGMLSREGVKISNPHLLIRPFVTREAVLSSRIEGTQTTLVEMLAQDAGANVDRNADDLQEVQNYILALDHGLQRLKELPLSLRIIKEMHEKLMCNVRGSHATPGAFRTSQNWIGSAGCTLNTAKYIPPAVEELGECLGLFEKFLHERTLPPLIHIALCHYQFEAIHPFLDGNGRIGRLLITLLLIEHKLLPSPLLYLSAFFEATRNEYYQYLYDISSHGNWNEWLVYFLNGVAIQSLDVLSRVERINNVIIEWRIQIGNRADDSVAQDVVKNLAMNPYCTVTNVAKNLNISFSTAQRAISKLERLEILSQNLPVKRGRLYCAQALLDILKEPTRIREELENSSRPTIIPLYTK